MAFAVVLCSCQKEGTRLFEGSYSFKTSGVLYARQAEPVDSLYPEDVTIMLATESGQMDMTPAGEDGRMFLTMNVTGGGIVVYGVSVDGDSVSIDPDRRNIVFPFPDREDRPFREDSDITVQAELGVTGSGKRYDNIILFRLDYTGSFTVDDAEYVIYDSDIDCRAKLNE